MVSRDLVRTELVDSLKIGSLSNGEKSLIIRRVGILLTICIRARPWENVGRERVRYSHKHVYES